MTKRALAVIALLLIAPCIVGLAAFVKWKNRNPVVAAYSGSVNAIEYDGEIYHRVENSENYCFELGKFLGKIDDRLTGAPLYLVKYDENGKYLAVSGNEGLLLYTKTGSLADGVEKENSKITAVSFNGFKIRCDDAGKTAELGEIFGSPINCSFIPNEWKEKKDTGSTDISGAFSVKGITVWKTDVCFDGSAIASKHAGWILRIDRKNIWFFVPSASAEKCDEAIESGELKDREYDAVRIDGISGIRLLKSIFEPESDTSEPEGTAAEHTVNG